MLNVKPPSETVIAEVKSGGATSTMTKSQHSSRVVVKMRVMTRAKVSMMSWRSRSTALRLM